MKERIRELAAQAGEEAVKSVPFFRTGRCQIPSWVNVFIEVRDKKFSNLLIQECITILDEDDGATHHTELLKQHFGVEE